MGYSTEQMRLYMRQFREKRRKQIDAQLGTTCKRCGADDVNAVVMIVGKLRRYIEN